MNLHELSPSFVVSSQITEKDITALVAAGVGTIINNRPDGEIWGQPTSAALEVAAIAAGMKYFYIPVRPGEMGPAHIAEIKAVQAETIGKILGFCRTGTRSANLWALAQAGTMPADEIIAAGTKVGYNLEGLRPHLVEPSSPLI
ncbi:MAG: TIGR01244 family phosphatase [Robiginitomaculum sp.]|nr:TIGR01244 family phosphatase [Robiginitomaculum sp.]